MLFKKPSLVGDFASSRNAPRQDITRQDKKLTRQEKT